MVLNAAERQSSRGREKRIRTWAVCCGLRALTMVWQGHPLAWFAQGSQEDTCGIRQING